MNFTHKQLEKFCQDISSDLNDVVFNNIHNYLREHPEERCNLNPAFPFPQMVRIGILQNHLAIEYIGPNKEDEKLFHTELSYKPEHDLYDYLGIDIKHLNISRIPVDESMHDMNFFLGESFDYLTNYFYDFTKANFQ